MTKTTEKPAPLLTRDEFLELPDVAALVEAYTARGFEPEPGKDLIDAVTTRAQQDWFQVAFEAAKQIKEAPERFEPEVVAVDGLKVRIYGVFHGLIGGNDREYKDFVNAALREQEVLLFENALGYFYPAKTTKVGIPDFLVNRVVGHLRLGLAVGIEFPLLLLEGFLEVFKLRRRPDDDSLQAFEYSPRYHAIDAETRRGLEPDPPLPSRLDIDYWQGKWDAAGWIAPWKFIGAVVPRSMFMAGFAVGYAQARELSEVSLVVGDYHTMEIVRFLEDPRWREHPMFQLGVAWGARSDGARIARAWALKIVYLSIAGIVGAGLMLTVIVGVLLVVQWTFFPPVGPG